VRGSAPIPITKVFPDVPTTEEQSWQERVIDHLRLDDWQHIVIHDEPTCSARSPPPTSSSTASSGRRRSTATGRSSTGFVADR
jgi:hypothetical protein